MSRSITAAFTPTYELIVSLIAFADRGRWKNLDLSTTWGRQVEGQLGAGSQLIADAIPDTRWLIYLFPLVQTTPGDGSPAAFIDRLAALSPGELYEHFLCIASEEERRRMPPDLGTWRDGLVQALTAWHEGYFRHLNPAILAHLQREAERVRAELTSITPSPEWLADLTSGLYLDTSQGSPILLIPQHHFRPWILGADDGTIHIILFPVEPAQEDPEAPPLSLMRLTRALADENRLRILRYLAHESLGLSELTERTGLAKSTVHHHMVLLRTSGLVIVHADRNDGRYALRPGWLHLLTDRLDRFISAPPAHAATNLAAQGGAPHDE